MSSSQEESKIEMVDGVRTLIVQTSVFREKMSTVLGHLESSQVDQVHVMRRLQLVAEVTRPDKSLAEMLPVGPLEL